MAGGKDLKGQKDLKDGSERVVLQVIPSGHRAANNRAACDAACDVISP